MKKKKLKKILGKEQFCLKLSILLSGISDSIYIRVFTTVDVPVPIWLGAAWLHQLLYVLFTQWYSFRNM